MSASAQRCWSCGAGVPEAARFCSACGVRLDSRDYDNAAGSTCERRQLTVMFCDLVASTKLSLELDPEDFTSAIRSYRDVCARVVGRWKGYISRYVGDGALIYFGYPFASEDDALRGVSAAWELSKAISDLELPLSKTGRRSSAILRLQSRISLHTGVAIVGDVVGRHSAEKHDVLGAAPNIAARLQALAAPGEIVISEATAELLPPGIELQPLATGDGLKGEGVRALVIKALPRDLVQRRPVSAEPFVGRNVLLRRVLSSLNGITAGASGYLFLGDPGIGKSRFLRELISHTQTEGFRWIEVACSAYGRMSPLHPFARLLGEGDGDKTVDAETVQSGVRPTANGSQAPTSPFERRRQQFATLQTAIQSYSPSVGLAVEDVHWADSTTLEFLAELLSSRMPGRLLLMMTSRADFKWAFGGPGEIHVETLGRLLPGDAAAMAQSASPAGALSAFELAEIVNRADGVPLYIEEFVRAIGAHRSAAPDATEVLIPATLRDSLMSVLDGLGSTGRTVALAASVCGRRFDYAHLCSLLDFDEHTLVTALHALTAARILSQAGEMPNASFEFRHALLRDTAYNTLLKSERERLHRRFAQLTNAGLLPAEQSMPELLAIHHSLGGDYEQAISHWLKAAGRAMERSANAEALGHLRKGLEDCRTLASRAPNVAARMELEVLTKLPATLVAVSGWSSSELEQIFVRSKELCSLVGTDETEFTIERGRYNLHLLRSEVHHADAIARTMLSMAEAIGDADRRRALLLEGLRSRALVAFYKANYAEARALLEEVLSLYDRRLHANHAFRYGTEPAVMALSYLAWMDCIGGATERGRERAGEALRQAREVGHLFSICYATCFDASCAQLSQEPLRAATLAEDAVQLANQHNFQYWLAWGKAVRGWAHGQAAPEAGITMIEGARADYLATGSTLVAPYFDALACNIASLAGFEDVAAREASMRECAAETGVWFWEAALRFAKAQRSVSPPASVH